MYSIWERLKAGIEEILRTRVFVLIIVFCIMSSILVGRLFNLQIVNGQQYLDDYKLQIQKTRVTEHAVISTIRMVSFLLIMNLLIP